VLGAIGSVLLLIQQNITKSATIASKTMADAISEMKSILKSK
jgi:hypothetical protein